MSVTAYGPPLDPTTDQARQWLTAELAKRAYRDEPGLLQRFLDWVRSLLTGQRVDGAHVPAGPWRVVAALVVIALVAVIAYAVLRSVRVERGAGRHRHEAVLEASDTRTAALLRASARAAVSQGRWDDAVLDGFRATARGAVERALLDDLPGRTAHEVAAGLGLFYPSESVALSAASDAFDRVRYGRRPAGEAAARAVVDTDGRIARARPAQEETAPVPGGHR